MPIITISRGTYSKGKEIAEKIAKELGYICLSREIILEASEYFNLPEIRLDRVLHDSLSVLNRFAHGEKKYITFFHCAMLRHLIKDNVVYHGLAGHFFCQGVPHAMKVRIIADLETRIQEEMKREGVSEAEARRILVKDDQERQKWARALYGVDTSAPKLYDIVLRVDIMQVDDIVDTLIHVINKPCFQTTEENQQVLNDLYIAAQAKLILVDKFPESDAIFKAGTLYVKINSLSSRKNSIYQDISSLLADIPGINDIKLEINPVLVPD